MVDLFEKAFENKNIIDGFRPFEQETLKSLKAYYKIGLTFSSNALEGNSLTESETKVVIEDGLTIGGKPLRDIYEATGHAKAYDYVYDIVNNKLLKSSDILELHRLFYENIDSKKAGKYRQEQVFISGSRYKVTPPHNIEKEINEFVSWFNENEKAINPILFSALTHLKFIFIHPFIDGNGRVARLLMNLALLRNAYTIAIIPPILRSEYIASLEKAHTEEKEFIDFITQRVIQTQLELIRIIK